MRFYVGDIALTPKLVTIVIIALFLWWVALALIDAATGRKPDPPVTDPWAAMFRIRPFFYRWRVHVFGACLAATGFAYSWGETRGLW